MIDDILTRAKRLVDLAERCENPHWRDAEAVAHAYIALVEKVRVVCDARASGHDGDTDECDLCDAIREVRALVAAEEDDDGR